MQRRSGSAGGSAWDSGELIRAELFSVERLEQHAETLAAAQRVCVRQHAGRSLAARLHDDGRVLLASYRAIAQAIAEGRAITPAAEWLVDNYHVVEEQMRQITEDLPPGYYRELPKLADGPLAGYPRVFGLAWAFVAHTDSRFDAPMLCRFVQAYQRVQPLTIGELWAVAITLRIVLVENLRRAAERIASGRAARQQADALADRLLGLGRAVTEPLSAVLHEWDAVPLPATFAVQLLHRLRDQDPAVTPALTWLEARLAQRATSADEVVRDEHHRQGASNVTVRNVITSMRGISTVDWAEWFESVSLVDVALREGTQFAQMDFPTRDRYRRAIERLARGCRCTQLQIARRAVLLAGRGASERERDPGYLLIGGGRRAFEAQLGYRAPLSGWIERLGTAAGIRGYMAGISLLAAVLLAWPLHWLWGAGVGGWRLLALALLGAVPALEAAIALVNAAVTSRFGAKILPALELAGGVPAPLRTLIVMPTLLTTPELLAEHIERLEIHHLASPDGELYYALLSDWSDAAAESVAGDAALLEAATAGIARLNRRYAAGSAGERFRLLHRRRLWSAGQRQWMGWERKRGKLHELNRLLRGATDTSFIASVSSPVPSAVRYVITLDADTRLPREAVRRLIGKMAHPLNHAVFSARGARIVEGYAVLQPRVTPSLPVGSEGSIFQRLFSSTGGIDAYAGAVSDVYQDLCGEGSYVGKGIYDVDAFEAALVGRVPAESVLSHDLFEGIFARAGLVSDIEVVEEFPSRYDVAAARTHRWARGDWQLLPWVIGRRGLGLVGAWKIIDNLRRTLLAPAVVLALLLGWSLPWQAAVLWTAVVLAALCMPSLPPVLAGLVPSPRGISKRGHWRALFIDLRVALAQSALLVMFIAHQAWLMGDAIARTLWRLYVSRRCLLEWVTAAQSQGRPRLDVAGFYRRMAGAVLIAASVLVLSGLRLERAWVAVPFALLWLLSPAVARRVSRAPGTRARQSVSAAEARAMRRIARRTWRYFESFVTAADHQLPPDNFQEDPRAVIAHRTSPTNLGLYLLSTLAARDFGWLGSGDMLARLEATLAQMRGLERFRGHFYNWYDTQDLRPLEPKYVSSVDSGNLAGHLLALANGCQQMIARPQSCEQRLAGIDDGLRLARECAATHDAALQAALAALAAGLQAPLAHADELAARLAALASHAALAVECSQRLTSGQGEDALAELAAWTQALQRSIDSHRADLAGELHGGAGIDQRLAAVADTARSMAQEMHFDFLFDAERKLLSIGYRCTEGALDPSCYDLLASEARLASFVAIASGDLPARHWFRLGRTATPIACGAALVSWAGSMFEYLMPSLVMRAPTGSLLEQTNELIVGRQRAYGEQRQVPWGISESAYNARDLELTYQYSSFGVPGLGLKRGLGDSLVIAPYASALAAMVDPRAAIRNFEHLAALGAEGRYGFYEALDYTPRRLPALQPLAIVRAYMAHHQGMTIVALANTLMQGVMRARLHSEPSIQAAELLLQERTPRDVAVAHVRAQEHGTGGVAYQAGPVIAPLPNSVHDVVPRTRLLSNGRYAVMLTAAGSGYSRWRDLAVTRWREDLTCDAWGSYVFVRDVDSGKLWSAGYQPSVVESAAYEAVFSEDRAQFLRDDDSIGTTMEVLVSAESDAEVRRVTFVNSGKRVRLIEVTSYAELVLGPAAADSAHPAFSKLFVQTEYLPEFGAILATRRRREPTDSEIWAAHVAIVEGESVGELQLETDRARFLGRARELRSASAMQSDRALSGTVGTVLDPIFSLRRRLRLAPGAMARVAFWTLVAPSRAQLLDLVDTHHDAAAFDRAAMLAWTQAQLQLHHLGISIEEAMLFQRLAGYVLYSAPTLRPSSEVLRRGGGGQNVLWAHGISGDLPIVLVRIDDSDDLGLVRQLLRAFEYWRLKLLPVDLVILNERAPSYAQDLQSALEMLSRTRLSRPRVAGEAAEGAVFILRADVISSQTRAVLLTAARAVLLCRRGSLAEQLVHFEAAPPLLPRVGRTAAGTTQEVAPAVPAVEFFNGLGGFTADGQEYLTILREAQCTPAPWINVIANADFGFQVSAEGAGYSWAGNSRDHQLTTWSNDPVADRPSEVLYVRDDDSGALWGPTASPMRHATATYITRHGRGYSCFEHAQRGIALELLQFVPLDAPIKLSRLSVHNTSSRTRRLSLTAYVEWVLGSSRSASAPFIATEIDVVTGAMLARNLWQGSELPVAFMDLAGRQTAWTGDRSEFLGRHGTLAQPAALGGGATLSGRVGMGLDPCGALQTSFELKAHERIEIVWLLGEAPTLADAQRLIGLWRGADLGAALAAVRGHWQQVLGAVTVRTPDRAFDLMLNGWLLYQTLACRMWARSAFYQASGAYGFRDQLQDSMALVVSQPALTRAHLLRAAARQFVAGDVQHWWLPQTGRGVRSRVSDDRAWLCYCVAHYVEVSGDRAILDEPVPFLDGPALREHEVDSYFQPTVADESASLFEHCARALDQSLAVGAHGLPLMGSGDWNDGMNRVGALGAGESVWLGWFLLATLSKLVTLAQARGELARAERWRSHAGSLRAALHGQAWDGNWYRRGYYDDGTPLGSAQSSECQIDAIAQSWAVISGAADPERARRAMAAVNQQLVRRDPGLLLLFTPPFDQGAADPGYVKAYPPGIRENGGQYTHAAVWSVIAFAMLGDAERAAELFSILNPINRARTRADVWRYKLEPYVVAADVYSEPPHVGRGGWSWYTGSSGWLYRAGLEWILGCRVQGASLLLEPRLPRSWDTVEISLRHRDTRYEIVIEVPNARSSHRRLTALQLDGVALPLQPALVALVDDGITHRVRAVLGDAMPAAARTALAAAPEPMSSP